jgi:hypothetical protein
MLCFKKFKLSEIGSHYDKMHAESDLKALGLHPEALKRPTSYHQLSQMNETLSNICFNEEPISVLQFNLS